jgi:hypothetical protein
MRKPVQVQEYEKDDDDDDEEEEYEEDLLRVEFFVRT